MSSNSPLPVTTEQRLLAAIVFTDVAGFSSRVEAEETTTLALLERDFVTMRLFSTAHSGTVIKSTGDGLMLYFTSAVEAVEWALKTQRHFAEQAAELPPEQILRHRIGIHLGDVFVSAGDVMGDGVNVAARVQAEAAPGGICISQVVYGMVKNKLKLDVVRLEPRKLKNINEAVQMYHVLLEPPARKAPEVAAPEVEDPTPARKTPIITRVILFIVLAVGAGAAVVLMQMYHRHETGLAGSEEMRRALGAALRSEQATQTVEAATPPAPASSAPAVAEQVAQPLGSAPVEEFNFLKATRNQPALAGVSPAQDAALQQAEACIRILDTWRAAALQRYTRNRPLLVRPFRSPVHSAWRVFTDTNGKLTFAEGGAFRPQAWEDLRHEAQGAIVASLLRDSPEPVTPDIARGAEAFAFVHGLPELAALLVRE